MINNDQLINALQGLHRKFFLNNFARDIKQNNTILSLIAYNVQSLTGSPEFLKPTASAEGKNIRPKCERPSRRDNTSSATHLSPSPCHHCQCHTPGSSRVAQQSMLDAGHEKAQTLAISAIGDSDSPHHRKSSPKLGQLKAQPVNVTIPEKSMQIIDQTQRSMIMRLEESNIYITYYCCMSQRNKSKILRGLDNDVLVKNLLAIIAYPTKCGHFPNPSLAARITNSPPKTTDSSVCATRSVVQ